MLVRLQRVQNSAARLVTRSKKFDHVTLHLKSLHWLPVIQRIDFKVVLLLFNWLERSVPSYLSDQISRYEPLRSLCITNTRPDLIVPRVRTEKYGSTSFSFVGPAIWNSFPLPIKAARTVPKFRKTLKSEDAEDTLILEYLWK